MRQTQTQSQPIPIANLLVLAALCLAGVSAFVADVAFMWEKIP
jgi:hypothetical protein